MSNLLLQPKLSILETRWLIEEAQNAQLEAQQRARQQREELQPARVQLGLVVNPANTSPVHQ